MTDFIKERPIFPLLLSFILVIYGGGAVLIDLFLQDVLLPESRWCRILPCGDRRFVERAYHRLWEPTADAAARAVPLFEEALLRDPGSADRWCDLGNAYWHADKIRKARFCFEQAVELAPNWPPVLVRAGNFYFALDSPREALPLMRQVLKVVREYDKVIFGSYRRMGVSTKEILSQGLPVDAEPAQSYFRFLLDGGTEASVAEGWNWLCRHSLADQVHLNRYVNYLLKKRRYEHARKAFYEFTAGAAGDIMANRVFNPGFEDELTGAALDWHVRSSANAEVTRDSDAAKMGSWSLRIRFGGEENLHFRNVSQKIVIEPGTFLFRAWIRTDGITTDQGVRFRVSDTEDVRRLHFTTENLIGTTDWRIVEQDFRVSPETQLIQVQVVREPSLKFDNKISGSVWIDDVSITRR